MKHNYLIGCGGVGSWLAPALCSLIGPKQFTVIDGDKLENKNLDRQLFTLEQVGMNKAEALAERYDCSFIADWYSFDLLAHTPDDWLFVAVDNDSARVQALQACDRYDCRAIIGANETFSADAYLYLPDWHGTRLDPRVIDPAMVQAQDDPQRAAMGCVAKQKENPQLGTANRTAAVLMERLYLLWAIEYPKMDRQMIQHLARKLVINLNGMELVKTGTL